MLTLPSTTSTPASTAATGQAGNRILFLVVVCGADSDCLEDPRPAGPRYTRDSMRSLLQLLGCKPRLAYKIMLAVFQAVDQAVTNARQQRISRKTFQVHPHRNGKVYVSLTRADFMLLVSTCAAQYSYKISPSSDELKVACSLRERRRCVIVLLSGTSGSGKSTLASILASRLGITTVISTDSIRHMLRSFNNKESSPLLWSSTYQAGEAINPIKGGEVMSESERAVSGYKAQCELLAEQLETLIAGCEARQQSLICEGVHLSISAVLKLMSRHPDVLPFLVHINSEEKHVERMAVRAKYMTLDPHKNRYVRYMGNIRLIQEYLVRKADKYCIPRVENSNVDRSVGIIHLTVMGCLRRMAKGETVLDHASGKTNMLAAEYAAVLEHLQGEKERVAARVGATAAAAAAAGSAADAGASSSKQQESGVSAVSSSQAGSRGPAVEAGTSNGSSSSRSRQRKLVPADSALPAAALLVQMQPAGSSHRSTDLPGEASAPAAAAAAASRPTARRRSVELQESRHQQQQQEQKLQAAAAVPGHALCASDPQQQQPKPSSTAQPGFQPWQDLPLLNPICTTTAAANQFEAAAFCAAAAAAAFCAGSSGVGDGDVLVMSPDGPVMRWEKFLDAGRLSPGDDVPLAGSPSSPLAAAGLAMAWPHGSSTVVQQQQLQYQDTADSKNLTTEHAADEPQRSSLSSPSVAACRSSNTDVQNEQQLTVADSEGAGCDNNPDDADIDESVDGHASETDHLLSTSSSMKRDSSSAEVQLSASNMDKQEVVPSAAVAAAVGDVGDDDDDDDEEEEETGVLGVSSGEELDGLGDLGSSDNEGERFLQEYGSMGESTTCDEHDDDDLMGSVGLRAWNGGMARALWPSYHHVYNNSNSSGSSMLRGMRSADGNSSGSVGVLQHSRPGDHGGPGLGLRQALGPLRSGLGRVAEDVAVADDALAAADDADAQGRTRGLPPQPISGSATAPGSAVAVGSRVLHKNGNSSYLRVVGGSNSSRVSRQRWSGSGGADVGSLQQLSGVRAALGVLPATTRDVQQQQPQSLEQRHQTKVICEQDAQVGDQPKAGSSAADDLVQ